MPLGQTPFRPEPHSPERGTSGTSNPIKREGDSFRPGAVLVKVSPGRSEALCISGVSGRFRLARLSVLDRWVEDPYVGHTPEARFNYGVPECAVLSPLPLISCFSQRSPPSFRGLSWPRPRPNLRTSFYRSAHPPKWGCPAPFSSPASNSTRMPWMPGKWWERSCWWPRTGRSCSTRPWDSGTRGRASPWSRAPCSGWPPTRSPPSPPPSASWWRRGSWPSTTRSVSTFPPSTTTGPASSRSDIS